MIITYLPLHSDYCVLKIKTFLSRKEGCSMRIFSCVFAWVLLARFIGRRIFLTKHLLLALKSIVTIWRKVQFLVGAAKVK